MRWISRLMAGALVAAVLAGCSLVAPTVDLRTREKPDEVCLMALGHGILVRNADSGLAMTQANGEVMPVQWPFGYSARVALGRVVLLDEAGAVLAREGDGIKMGGGYLDEFGDPFFWSCGDVTVIQPAG
jgi:hypothetical protein